MEVILCPWQGPKESQNILLFLSNKSYNDLWGHQFKQGLVESTVGLHSPRMETDCAFHQALLKLVAP